jgi:drug/metabolite transporter (DMT)-like permease
VGWARFLRCGRAAIAVIFLKERLTPLRLSGVLAIALGAVVLIGAP